MKFQVNQGWAIGQFFIPSSTIIDLAPDKREEDHTEFEKLARGHLPPPIDACALDWDSAVTMHRAYPEFHYRLHRHLSAYDEDMYQRIIGGELNV